MFIIKTVVATLTLPFMVLWAVICLGTSLFAWALSDEEKTEVTNDTT